MSKKGIALLTYLEIDLEIFLQPNPSFPPVVSTCMRNIFLSFCLFFIMTSSFAISRCLWAGEEKGHQPLLRNASFRGTAGYRIGENCPLLA